MQHTVTLDDEQVEAIRVAAQSAERDYLHLENYERTSGYPGGTAAWAKARSVAFSRSFGLQKILEQVGAV